MSFDKSYEDISKDLLEKIKSITSEKKSLYEKTVEVSPVNTSYLDRNSVEPTDVNEDVEQLDELSDDTLRNYRKAAQAVVDTKKKGRPSAADVALKAKRNAGIDKATGILNDRSAKKFQKYQEDTKEVRDHIHMMAPSILMAHGYSSAGNTPNSQMFFKVHPEHGLVTHFKLHHPKADNYHMGEFGSSIKGWSSADTHKHEDGDSYFIKKKDVPERKKDTELQFRKKINDYEAEQKNRALNESIDPEVEAVLQEGQGSSNRVEKMGKKNADFEYKKFDNKRYDKKSFDRSKRQIKDDDDVKEEVELDEVSKNTLASYISKAAKNISSTSHSIGKSGYTNDRAKDVNKRLQGIDKASNKMKNEDSYEDDDLLPEAVGSLNRAEPMRKKSSDEYSKDNSKGLDIKKNFDRYDRHKRLLNIKKDH